VKVHEAGQSVLLCSGWVPAPSIPGEVTTVLEPQLLLLDGVYMLCGGRGLSQKLATRQCLGNIKGRTPGVGH
jgi:hypothetical protein